MMIDRRSEEKAGVLPAVGVLGEVLWDVFGESRRLGGAPLNFAAQIRRLGHPVSLISALGTDGLGDEAAASIARLGLDASLLQRTPRFATGTAEVRLARDGNPEFTIRRPAAYDAIDLSVRDIEAIRRKPPAWFYFGTLLASSAAGGRVLDRLLAELDGARRFLDLNLRPGSDSPALVTKLLAQADVLKLNEEELGRVRAATGLPAGVEPFCRAASDRFGFGAIAVTLGERGCAVLIDAEYAEAAALPVTVADTVGAGDAFAAAFVHGLSRSWRADEIAAFANRIAAGVVGRYGSLPEDGPETAGSG
jgi:fructokinase